MFEIELIRLGIFYAFSTIYSIRDLKTRYIEDYLFAVGILFELGLLIPEGWNKLVSIVIETVITYIILLLSTIFWLKIRRKIPFGLADTKYLTFLASYKGFFFAYLSLTFSLPIALIYCRFKSCKYLPFIPFLFMGAILSLVILQFLK